MNDAKIQLLPYIQQFDEAAQVLELLYVFADVDVLPLDDPLGVSPHLLLMFRHVWMDAMQMAIKLSIAEGPFTDAADVEITLEERYVLDRLTPSGMVPHHQLALASVVDVEGFLAEANAMFVYHAFRAVYRAKSTTLETVPATHRKVPGVGISPYADGGWFAPRLGLADLSDGSVVLGVETFTPSLSGYDAWYNAGGRMFVVFHPCITNAILRSNLATTGYGAAAEEVWTWKLLQPDEEYPACVPAYSVFSADINDHFQRYYCALMGFPLASVAPNYDRGAWADYDWSATLNTYYWSHTTHGAGCPLACEYCYKNVQGYGSDATSIRREWVLGSYGRPGTRNRDLYAYLTSVPAEYFPEYAETYLFVDGRSLDVVTKNPVWNEWDATGPGSSHVQFTHYGGLAGSIRYQDMIVLDRAHSLLSSAGVTGGAFSASPINYMRHYRHEGDGRRDGVLYLLGSVLPEEYTVYYRPVPDQPTGGTPLYAFPKLGNASPGELKVVQDDMIKHTPMYHGEPLEYNGEEVVYV